MTLETGSAWGDSTATRAWPASCTATDRFSLGSRAFVASRRPRMMRSLATKKSSVLMASRPLRMATMAASLTRLARSAPENPGVPRETESRSTSFAMFFFLACNPRIIARSFWLGSGI